MIKKLSFSFFPIVLVVTLLSACDRTPTSTLKYLDTTDTLRGVDKDDNGIRDDIDRYINSTPLKANQKQALSQYAEALQSSLLIDTTSKKSVKVSADTEMRALSCIFRTIPYEDRESTNAINEILGATMNTALRKKSNKKLSSALDGSIIHVPNSEQKVCDNGNG